jgi:uncharacterized membrane protein YdbT with pleckstrin-like domain
MNKDEKFISRTSQFSNILTFFINIIITAIILFFSDKIIGIPMKVIDIISQYKSLPEITSPIGIYFIIFMLVILWSRVIWQILLTNSLYYEFESERIVLHFGVLNKETNYIEYFRIKDYTIKRPLIVRILGLYNLELVSTDRTHPYLYMRFLTNFKGREEELRELITIASSTGRGREVDVV